MKKNVFLCLIAMIYASSMDAQTSKAVSKVNLMGAGYSMEYFFNPNVSWQNELGVSYWEKLEDLLQNKQDYAGIPALNPYFSSALRYYFKPIQPSKNGDFEIGWRLSATYIGHYYQSKYFQFSGKNVHRGGITLGTNIHFAKNAYFEIDLGPGYEWNDCNGNQFNLIGGIGCGFRF